MGAYFTYSGKLTQTITCSYPFHGQKLYCWAINSETQSYILSDWIQFTQPNKTTILENFALLYIDLATVLPHTLYPYPYHYTRKTIQYNQYKSARHTSAKRYSHVWGLTAYIYTIQCQNTREKNEINYGVVADILLLLVGSRQPLVS